MADEGNYPNKLTKGSVYRIISQGGEHEQFVSVGEFMGYVQFGQGSGLCLKLQSEDEKLDGMLRIVPAGSALIIDVLSYKPEEDLKKEPASGYYN